ncbi:MAG TPA: formylglycine-generating enzyme family protein [Pirellulales bacterium]|nr:formylglycine-generating enzyme family protein [Pirellulales bacterium]
MYGNLLAGLALLTVAAANPAEPAVTNSIGMRLVLIPAGQYLAGSPATDAQAEADERPAHRVTISQAFYLGQFEVTQDEFARVMGENPSWFARGAPGERDLGGASSGRWPVDMVAWDDSIEFCHRLSQLPAERAAGRGYRLPTEAQWEYACRAGSSMRFAFGEQLSSADANVRPETGAGSGHPVAVGSYRPNAFGLYDMHGNVWEWCADNYDASEYERVPAVDPAGPATSTGRVVRGGDWQFPARYARSANRDFTRASRRDLGNGFRVVISVR